MARIYSKGFVFKHHGKWRLALDYREGETKKRLTKTTPIRCCEDTYDDATGKLIKRDNRGKAQATLLLNQWRDNLVLRASAAEDEARRIQEEERLRQGCADTSLYDYAQKYLSNHHAKESTLQGYRAALHRLNGSRAASTPIGELTAKEILEWEADLYKDGLTQTTVAKYHSFVSQVLKFATSVGDIDKHPLKGVMRAPRAVPKPVNALIEKDSLMVVRTLCSMERTDLVVGALIALKTGMRRAEICALRWTDIDFTADTIHLTHAFTKVVGGWRLDTPKDPCGGDATRDIPFGIELKELFDEWRYAQRRRLLDFGAQWSDSLFVIGNPYTGNNMSPAVFGRAWSTLATVMNWRGTQNEIVTLHDLRHTFATLAVAHNMDIMCLASILGHRDPGFTLRRYAIVLEDSKRRSMQIMDGVITLKSVA